MDDYNIDVEKRRPGRSVEDWSRVTALRAEGKTIKAVADILGVHETTLYHGRKKGLFIDPGQVKSYKKRAARTISPKSDYSRVEVRPENAITLKINGVQVSGTTESLKALLGVW